MRKGSRKGVRKYTRKVKRTYARRQPMASAQLLTELKALLAAPAPTAAVDNRLVAELQQIDAAVKSALRLVGVGSGSQEAPVQKRRGRKPGRKVTATAEAASTAVAATAPARRGRQKKAAVEVDVAFQNKVTAHIAKTGRITRAEAAKVTGETSIKTGYLLRQLADQGVLVMQGTRRGAYYELKGQKASVSAPARVAVPRKVKAAPVVEEGPTDDELAALEAEDTLEGIESVEAIAEEEGQPIAEENDDDQPRAAAERLNPPRRAARSPLA